MVSGRASTSAVVFVVLLSAACGGSQPPTPAAAPPPTVKTPEQRAAFYVECWRQLNDKNWDAFQNCYTEQAMSETVDSAQGMRHNRAAIIDFDRSEATSFPDRRGEVKLVLVNGSHLASIASWTATHDGPLPAPPNGKPIPATHKKVGFYLAHTAELNETGAQVTSDSVYVDEATTPAQLGLVKAPSRPVLTPTGTPPTIVLAKNDETERKNVDAFKAMVDAFSKHDAKAFADVMADDYRGIDVTMPADMNK
jgi:predicted ester cyclase